MKVHNYDIIIVGGGIAGLYSAYKIQKISPQAKILVLERYKKKWFGGRLGNFDFHGVSVVNGAGVGRKEKDKLLINLLNELDVPFHEFHKKQQFASTIHPPCNVKKPFYFLEENITRTRTGNT